MDRLQGWLLRLVVSQTDASAAIFMYFNYSYVPTSFYFILVKETLRMEIRMWLFSVMFCYVLRLYLHFIQIIVITFQFR